jgi:hypothetical protein
MFSSKKGCINYEQSEIIALTLIRLAGKIYKNDLLDLEQVYNLKLPDVAVPDTASHTSEDDCKWYKRQMIYFPETIKQ